MPKLTKKQRRNYIDDKAFLTVLHANQEADYDVWLAEMRKACTASEGTIEDNFDTHVRRKAGQILRRINDSIEKENRNLKAKDQIAKWKMPAAPPKSNPTFLDLARELGLGGLTPEKA
jgi:hypothetical protein